MDAAAARHPDVPYRPMLIDAAYAGLLTEADDQSLVIPALNRDGDCLSDLVLALFGSIAGAESVLLALDDDLRPTVAMAEAPHGTAPSLRARTWPTRWPCCWPVPPPSTMPRWCRATPCRDAAHGHPGGHARARRPTGSAPSTSGARPPPARWSTR